MLIACYVFSLLSSTVMLRNKQLRVAGAAAFLASAVGLAELWLPRSPRVLDIGMAACWLVSLVALMLDGVRFLRQGHPRRAS